MIPFPFQVGGFGLSQPSGAAGGDPFFANVSSLLHCDGTNGSTTFTDVKGKTWTVAGGATISTAQSLFGGASGLFGGYIETGDNADFELGNGDFCLEQAVRFSSLPASGDLMCFFTKWENGKRSFYSGLFNDAGTLKLFFGYSTDGTTQTVLLVNWTPSTATWYRVAISRQSADLKFWVDGTQQGATQNIGTATIFNSTSKLYFGTAEAGGGSFIYRFLGYADELRFTKGQARRTANYTPDAAAFPDF